MSDQGIYEPIPQPPGYPVLGNLFDLRGAATPTQALMKLARQYGPIFRFHVGPRRLTVISGFDLVDELCDEERFDKMLGPGQINGRAVVGDGLFTSWTQEPNWKKAHNILLPNFGMRAIRNYFPMMTDIATQLVGKWERLNPEDEIDVPADMTRLTLDTIGLCGFGYRFNSFYRSRVSGNGSQVVRASIAASSTPRVASTHHRGWIAGGPVSQPTTVATPASRPQPSPNLALGSSR